MILNQYERSVHFITENAPNFIRRTFTSFVSVYSKISNNLAAGSSNNAFTVNEISATILKHGIPFWYIIENALNEEQFHDFIHSLERDVDIYSQHLRTFKQESALDFHNVNGADIYAPVTSIRASVTPFAAVDSCFTDGAISICFQMKDKFWSNREMYIEEAYKTPWSKASTRIEGMIGDVSVLDDLQGECVVDISTLFDYYFSHISKHSKFEVDPEIPDTYTQKFIALNEFLKDPDCAATIIDSLTSKIVASMLCTYFIFAGKLKGAKPDIVSWAYKAFVKDSVDNFDQAMYPSRAPVTVASGHGMISGSQGKPLNEYERPARDYHMDNDETSTGNALDSFKALIYRNIRLQFSTWSAILNEIFYSSASKRSMFDGQERVVFGEAERESIIELCRAVLYRYVSASYRTYSTSIQLDKYGNATPSNKYISTAVSSIRDEDTVAIVKKYKPLIGARCYVSILPKDAQSIGVLGLNVSAMNALSKTFLKCCYLLMLNHCHDNIKKTYSQMDVVTVTKNITLFEEIYSGIKNSIDKDFSHYTPDIRETIFDYISEDIKSVIAAILPIRPYNYTAYEDLGYDNELMRKVRSLKKVLAAVNPSSADFYRAHNGINKFTEFHHVDIPLFSDYWKIEHRYKNVRDVVKREESDYTATIPVNPTETFAKNKVVLDTLNYTNLDPIKGFKSLEDCEECLNLIEGAIEGSDAMACNAGYSMLGSIGGSITELEIRNQSDTGSDPMAIDSGDGGVLGDEEDTNGLIIHSGTSDTEDQLKFTRTAIESVQIQKLVNRYNKLFNKYVFGIS